MTAESESLLERLRRLDKEARPRPWRVELRAEDEGDFPTIVTTLDDPGLRPQDRNPAIAHYLDSDDADLIVALRNALPEIIEAFELLREGRVWMPRVLDTRDNPGSATLWARPFIEVMREHPEYARDAYDEVVELLQDARDALYNRLPAEVRVHWNRDLTAWNVLNRIDELLSKVSEP